MVARTSRRAPATVPWACRSGCAPRRTAVCSSGYRRSLGSARASQAQDQAALRQLGFAGVEAPGGKWNAALERAVRDFEMAHGKRTPDEGQRTLAAHDQCAVVVHHLDA